MGVGDAIANSKALDDAVNEMTQLTGQKPVITKAKKSVLDGIGYVASLVDHDRIFVSNNCEETIEMFDGYRWDPKEGLLKERPLHDDYSHLADALRYAIYTHSYNVIRIGE